MVAHQTECFRLEQRSVIIFLVPEKCKSCEIYKRTCECAQKNMFAYGLKMNFPLQVCDMVQGHGRIYL